MPRKGQTEGDVCFRKCLEAVRTGAVSAGRETFSMLHVKDAAAFIYAVMSAESHAHSDYQLSSMRELSELELSQIISEEAGFPVKVLERKDGGTERNVLNASRFTQEFGLSATADYRKEVGEIVRFIKRNKSSYVDPEEVLFYAAEVLEAGGRLLRHYSRIFGRDADNQKAHHRVRP